ncbi:hypothetical protein [Qipengyuania qiaonensis]|uniref:Uncharacterized protein n=1 Tax=Qipengyuania qiaonensis TaxID=2867240 RepID=A0ABS7J2Y1_9SPHN|nr:hypothetical protein [Qipengyuania qiaonensis]MBX7481673.1 hypothetical protein [Qipengyuania qiaonensis]
MAVPPIEVIHTDVDFANRYRLELNKTLLALAAGLLAFTISFPPALTAITHDWLLGLSWAALAGSLLGGLFNLYGWEKFYISYRDFAADEAGGDAYRKTVTFWRRLAHGLQFAGFIGGVIALASFVIVNRANVKLADPPTAAAPANKAAVVPGAKPS